MELGVEYQQKKRQISTLIFFNKMMVAAQKRIQASDFALE
jgi:hypothetical protein